MISHFLWFVVNDNKFKKQNIIMITQSSPSSETQQIMQMSNVVMANAME